MKDEQEREKGKYEEKSTKVKDNVIYTMTETTVVGRDFEIMSYSREYTPGLKYPITWEKL